MTKLKPMLKLKILTGTTHDDCLSPPKPAWAFGFVIYVYASTACSFGFMMGKKHIISKDTAALCDLAYYLALCKGI